MSDLSRAGKILKERRWWGFKIKLKRRVDKALDSAGPQALITSIASIARSRSTASTDNHRMELMAIEQ